MRGGGGEEMKVEGPGRMGGRARRKWEERDAEGS